MLTETWQEMEPQIRKHAGRLILDLGVDRLDTDVGDPAMMLEATGHRTGLTSDASLLIYE